MEDYLEKDEKDGFYYVKDSEEQVRQLKEEVMEASQLKKLQAQGVSGGDQKASE